MIYGEEFKNINFSTEDLNVINLYKPLADWFSKLSFPITRFEFQYPHYKSYFNEYPVNTEQLYAGASRDVLVLEKMATTAMCWIQSDGYPDLEKAVNAALAISKIYEEYKGQLSKETFEAF